MLHCQLCSTHYIAVCTNQELLENHLCNQSNHYGNTGGAMNPTYVNYHVKVKYLLRFFVSYVQLIT